MKTSLLALFFFLSAGQSMANKDFYSLSAKDIDDKPVALSKYAGKVSLVVNTASECGYTPQYKGLEALYLKYKAKGFVVLGFPSNDFGAQEPGSNAEIKKFCELKFKVSFPMFSKDRVTGDDKQSVYKFLTEAAAEKGEVKWNFEKFLINKKGEVVGRYKSGVTPDAAELDQAIAKLVQ